MKVRLIAVLSVMALAVLAGEKSSEVPFPEAYRSWLHVKSVVFGPGHPQFASEGLQMFHFFANAKAVEGYRAGKFPNGSIIVRETLRTAESDSKGVIVEKDRSALDVMVKDDQLYKETGGWGFDRFNAKNERLSEKDRAQCFACHGKQKDHDLVFSTLPAGASGTGDSDVPFPDGYRHWTFLHSSMVPPTFDSFKKKPCEKPCMAGIFHFYGNDKAMEGLRTGTYPDGSILAEEMLEWQTGANGGAKEGPRRVVGVMVKDSRRYADSAGWGFGNFDEGSRTSMLDAAARTACYTCHIARKDKGYVFTEYRER